MRRVEANIDILRWARERSGVTIEELVRSFPKFPGWETGAVSPTLHQLERFAKKTYTPLGFFFLERRPEDRLPIPDFRTVRDRPVMRPSPNLLEVVHAMQRRQEWMREFLLAEREDPLPFVGTLTLATPVVEAAAAIRRGLQLQPDWASRRRTWSDAFIALRDAAEGAGVLVVANGIVRNNTHRKLDVEEFRGFVLNDRHAPLIFVNAADYKSAQMFTLAHELAHVWLGEDGVFNLRTAEPSDNEIERFCNRVAAEFLVPEDELRRLWGTLQTLADPFNEVAREFRVSVLVAARRLLDLAFITRDRFLEFYQAYLEDEHRKHESKTDGGDFYRNQNGRVGKRFGAAVVRAAREGKLLYRDAYNLTDLYGLTFDKYAAHLGFPARG